MELCLCLEIFEFRICLINILLLQGALFPRPEALDPLEAHGTTLDPMHWFEVLEAWIPMEWSNQCQHERASPL